MRDFYHTGGRGILIIVWAHVSTRHGKELGKRLMCGSGFNNVRRWNTKMLRSICGKAIATLCQMSLYMRNAMHTLLAKKYEAGWGGGEKKKCV